MSTLKSIQLSGILPELAAQRAEYERALSMVPGQPCAECNGQNGTMHFPATADEPSEEYEPTCEACGGRGFIVRDLAAVYVAPLDGDQWTWQDEAGHFGVFTVPAENIFNA